jgi:hypothetical protein
MNHKVDLAMLDVVWKTQQVSRFGIEESGWGQISVQFSGIASFYLESSRRWKAFRDEAAKAKQQT